MNENLKRELSFINTLEGWCSQEKAEAIAGIVLDHKPKVCVEVGVFGARSVVAFAMALRESNSGVIWGIDPWTKEAALEGEDGTPNGDWWAKLDLDVIRNGAMNAITRANLWPWTKFIVAKGSECAPMFRAGSIDVWHCDGNHSESKAYEDATTWLPLVKRKGIILFDDIDWPTTRHALNHLGTWCSVLADVGTCRIFRKN